MPHPSTENTLCAIFVSNSTKVCHLLHTKEIHYSLPGKLVAEAVFILGFMILLDWLRNLNDISLVCGVSN